MRYDIEVITPEIAAEMLKKNTGNRVISSPHLDFLIHQMKNGKWKNSGDPIRIARNGRILDGQHRLSAVIKSEVTIEALVIRDMEEEVFDVIDTGKMRCAGDVLTIAGILNGRSVAAISKGFLLYRRGYYTLDNVKDAKLSHADVLEFAAKNNDQLQDVTRHAEGLYRMFKGLALREYGVLLMIFSEISQDDAYEFLGRLSDGSMLEQKSPILLLRNKLIDNASNPAKLPMKAKLSLCIRAWNHFRRRSYVSFLQIASTKDFPNPI